MVSAAAVTLGIHFAERLAANRDEAGRSRQGLVNRVAIRISDIRRSVAGTSQPALDALRNIVLGLA